MQATKSLYTILHRRAAELGEVKYFIDTAGASPNQTSPEHIIKLDMIGTSYAIDEFAKVIAVAVLVSSSQVRQDI
jgi:hypothetical protein